MSIYIILKHSNSEGVCSSPEDMDLPELDMAIDVPITVEEREHINKLKSSLALRIACIINEYRNTQGIYYVHCVLNNSGYWNLVYCLRKGQSVPVCLSIHLQDNCTPAELWKSIIYI